MTTKQSSTSSSKRRVARTPVRPARMRAEPAKVMSLFELSIDVEAVVFVVPRHVKLSKEADAAIKHDLAEMLGHAVVQMRTTECKATARQDAPLLTTEQAAQLVGVSRPYMAKPIDTGAVNCIRWWVNSAACREALSAGKKPSGRAKPRRSSALPMSWTMKFSRREHSRRCRRRYAVLSQYAGVLGLPRLPGPYQAALVAAHPR
ncbi:hypothetical protein [Bordetella bronchialis]|uniref:hypothetical protein n=1 Tax=Bordetella bronchialis TaxID=463025 RepID=UPI001E3366B4|nr:hypothetical protein [Bordetella bronchialis]